MLRPTVAGPALKCTDPPKLVEIYQTSPHIWDRMFTKSSDSLLKKFRTSRMLILYRIRVKDDPRYDFVALDYSTQQHHIGETND